jgi:hypothetical protein
MMRTLPLPCPRADIDSAKAEHGGAGHAVKPSPEDRGATSGGEWRPLKAAISVRAPLAAHEPGDGGSAPRSTVNIVDPGRNAPLR